MSECLETWKVQIIFRLVFLVSSIIWDSELKTFMLLVFFTDQPTSKFFGSKIESLCKQK